MCRWLAYSGTPIKLEELLLKRDHSLIDQSLHSRMGATTTNGDGFGVGWYDESETPRVYRSTHPAWNDRNLKELAAGIRSPLFFAHIRASTGSAIQETNTHPFRYGNWLWMHNGLIRDFPKVHRELVKDIDDSLFNSIEGTTDSETMFYLALTFGLESDPVGAVEQMVGVVEAAGERHELENLSDETRVVVSEPLGDLPGAWNEAPESHYGIVQPGTDKLAPFAPTRQ